MAELILVTGGSKSGKTKYAEDRARGLGKNVVYVATCFNTDDAEMREKISKHRGERPSHWTTVENRSDIERVIEELPRNTEAVIVDSLSLLVGKNAMDGATTADQQKKIEAFCARALASPFPVIVVTDEVGLGLVPENKLGRDFREALGIANQKVAANADEVCLMVSGLPIKIKG